MSSGQYRVRRATLDDVSQLTALWEAMKFPAGELARRITEFQVAEDGAGKVLGAIGLQIVQKQGRLHSEGFTDFSLAEQLRSPLWERLQSVAANHGLYRLWTQEQAPFWSRCGLQKADREALEKLPAAWRPFPGAWLTLKLKEDLEEVISADKEFALFMESEKQRSARALEQARVLKVIATVLALILAGLVGYGAFLVIRHGPLFHH